MNYFDSHKPPACTPRKPCTRCRLRNYLVEHLHASEKDIDAIGDLLEDEAGPRTLLIEDLEISVRAKNSLRNQGIFTLGALADKTEHEVLRFENFGRKSFLEMRTLLRHHNLRFAGEASPG